MSQVERYKNKAEEKTNEYIALFKEHETSNKRIMWNQLYETMGNNLLRDLEAIRTNYLNRPDSAHRTMTDEDFYGSLVYKFRDECEKYMQEIGVL
ncbi:hypothetical protein [Chryseobacterium sp. WLY505]|uniref:hypothetical protein n=1 Tax=Chryseobacterium sp. WLY505 TaxID=3068892 RepID=UPI002796403F|nr:hypothetical protein [Chryseobacterium sp. WLY505]MDQ1859289.1 hypothetical protein [Chryseobacterium sp. WLY505]